MCNSAEHVKLLLIVEGQVWNRIKIGPDDIVYRLSKI